MTLYEELVNIYPELAEDDSILRNQILLSTRGRLS
jgi:hypothetical protein